MGLNNLTGGREFTLGKFKQNFKAVADHGALKNFRDPINKIVEKNETAIRAGRFKSADAIRKLQREENLSYDVKRDVGRIFKRLEADTKTRPDRLERRAVLDKAMKGAGTGVKSIAKDRPEKVPIHVRINRADSEFNQEKVNNNRFKSTQAPSSDLLGAGDPVNKPTLAPPVSSDHTLASTNERISLD